MAAPPQPAQAGQPMQFQFQVPPGQAPPTAEQIQQIQRQIQEGAARAGVSVQKYVEGMKAQAMRQQQQIQQQMRQNGQQSGESGQAPPGGQLHEHQHQHQGPPAGAQQISLNGGNGPPKPEALAVASFLRGQDLKLRTCLLNNDRKDMFRVKRAIRALQSPAYEKARKKNKLLPEVNDRVTAENAFKLLPMSLLALRVSKDDHSHDGHNHAPKKRVKGLWTVKVEQHQEAHDDMYYVWLYEGSQIKTKLYAVGALALILAVVFFPVWPYKMRLGVWYLSMAAMGVLGLFFAMAIFRLILFVITTFAAPPGLWLYPNLFEDVGFFDSFRPVWAWQETQETKKAARAAKKAKRQARLDRKSGKTPQSGVVEEVADSGDEDVGAVQPVEAEASAVEVQPGTAHHRNTTVEDASDSE